METINIYRGDVKTIRFNISESGTGTAYNASGLNAWFTVKENFDATGSPYLIETSGAIAGTGSIVTVELTGSQTNLTGIKAAELSLVSGASNSHITVKQLWIDFRADVRL